MAVPLDDSNSRVYRSGVIRHAVICWLAADYSLDWGDQHFDGPHVRVDGSNGPYGVELQVFFSTHRPVPECVDHYVKVARVRAMRVAEPITLVTLLNGTVEMVALVPAGAYLVQNPSGEQYAMSEEEFAGLYVPDE